MSASIVEEKCLNDILNWLTYERVHVKGSTHGQCSDMLERLGLGYCLGRDNGRKRLFRDMLNLNHQSVEVRYPDDYEQYPDHYNFKHSDNPGIYKTLSSINSWLYECSEGEPMESSLLYVTFLKIRYILIVSLVKHLPQTKEAGVNHLVLALLKG